MTIHDDRGGTVRRRRPPFAMVPEAMLDVVSDRAVKLYAMLDRYAGEDERAWPSRATMARRLGCSADSVDRTVKELVAGGWIHVERRAGPGKSNAYTVLDRPDTAAAGSRTGAAVQRRGSRTGADSVAAPVRHEREPLTRAITPNGAQGAEGRLIDLPEGAGDGERVRRAAAREIVTEHWRWCEQQNRPTPTLRGGRGSGGSPFVALASVVGKLLDAGHTIDAVTVALRTAAAYTVDALTLELNRNRPDRHAAPRSGADYVAVAQRRAACPDCGGSGWLEVDGTAVACEHPAAS